MLEKEWKSISTDKLHKVALPKLKKKELKDFANQHSIKIPKSLTNKKQILDYVLSELHNNTNTEKEKWIQQRLQEIKVQKKKEKKI